MYGDLKGAYKIPYIETQKANFAEFVKELGTKIAEAAKNYPYQFEPHDDGKGWLSEDCFTTIRRHW